MIALILLFSAILILAGYAKDRKVTSPIVIFPLLWTIISLMAFLQLSQLRDVSEKMYFIVFLGVLFFSLGALIVPNNRKYGKRNIIEESNIFKIILSIEIIGIIIFLIADVPIFYLLQNGSTMNDIYQMRSNMAHGYDTELSDVSYFLTVLLEYIARPILAISIPYTVAEIVLIKKYRNLFLCIILLVLGYINKANRMDIILAFTTYIYAFLFFNGHRLSKKTIIRFSVIIAIVLFVFLILSSIRSSDESNPFDSFYYYICANLPFADLKISQMEINHVYTFGLTSIHGLFRPFAQLMQALGIGSLELFKVAEVYANVEEGEYIGGYGQFNAFAGVFYFFYCDLGTWGVILFSFISGNIIEKLYIKAGRTNNFLTIVLFLMFMNRGVILSFYNFLLVGIPYGVSLLIILLLGYFKRKDIKQIKAYDIH